MGEWTTPASLKARLLRLWERGTILAARLGEAPLFPLTLRLTRPESRDLAARFNDVRRWVRALDEGSRAGTGYGYELVWEEINHRQVGRNRLPREALVPTEDDALALIGKRREGARFGAVTEATLAAFPVLRDWLRRRPLVVLEHAEHWDGVLAVLAWFRAHPRCGRTLRQIDVPGVDTKFIEREKGLFIELLDLILPADAVETRATGVRGFEARYGLATKPALVRFRILDSALGVGGLTDVATPAEQLARLDLPISRVFITENESNGLAFPPVERAIVIFGLGYGLERLAEAAWLKSKTIEYWGDIDTHGFAILDRLRAAFPDVRSLLMDRETLLAHRRFWATEPEQHTADLARLTPDEQGLYDDLRYGRLGDRVRLEQERVAFGALERALGRPEPG